MSEDPLLQNQGLSTESQGGNFPNIPRKTIKIVAAYMQLILELSKKETVNAKLVLENAQKTFSDDYIKSADILWKEKLAGTLRELLDHGIEANFSNCFKHFPKRDDNEDAGNFFKKIQSIKCFLNDYSHMTYPKALNYVKDAIDESCQEITEEVFDTICTDLIETLYEWFSKYCHKGTN